jgi:hypothetical protein
MTRFFVDDLVAAGVLTRRGALDVRDAYGVPCKVSGRAKLVVRAALAQGALASRVRHPLRKDHRCALGVGPRGPLRVAAGETHCYFTV